MMLSKGPPLRFTCRSSSFSGLGICIVFLPFQTAGRISSLLRPVPKVQPFSSYSRRQPCP